MKGIKKILAVMVAMVMTLGLTATGVKADGTTPHTITITNSDNKGAHTFTAYQVFAGTYIESGTNAGQLQGITWGAGVDGNALLAALKDDATLRTTFASATDAVTAAAAMGTLIDNSAEVEKLAEIIKANLKSPAVVAGSGTGTNSVTINVTGDGYYFIEDTTATMPDGDSYSRYILEVVKNVEAVAKTATVTSDKEIKDANDTEGTTTEWQKTADHDIGDHIPFRLTGTLPSNYDKYDTYKYVFHDKEGTGLTFEPSSVKVYNGTTEITSGFEVVTTGFTDDCTFEVRFADLKKIDGITKDSTIYVEYTSILNENAVIGNPGNLNESWLEYSNNPNAGGDGTGTTPHKTVVAFTYQLVVNKVNEQNTALPGAGFTLYKKDKNNAYNVVKVINTEGTTTFSFVGLDDGDYKLEETTVPTGYNKMADIEFSIEAEHDELITKLNGVTSTGKINLGTQEATASVADGSITADVVNQSGAQLPETGGIGTTIFYAIGSVLVVGAGILLISKKRMFN